MPTTARVPFALASCLTITAACGGGGDGGAAKSDGGLESEDAAIATGTGTADDPIVLSAGTRATSPIATDVAATAWYVVDLTGPGTYVLLTEDLPSPSGLDVRATPDSLVPDDRFVLRGSRATPLHARLSRPLVTT